MEEVIIEEVVNEVVNEVGIINNLIHKKNSSILLKAAESAEENMKKVLEINKMNIEKSTEENIEKVLEINNMNIEKALEVKLNLNLAIEKINNCEYRLAIDYFLILKNNLINTNYYIGICYYFLKEYSQSAEYFQMLKRSELKINNMLGLCYHHSQNYNLAIKHFKLAIEEGNKLSIHNIANTYLELKDYEKAIKSYQESGFKYANHSIGKCYVVMDDYKNASKYYAKALQQKDNNKLDDRLFENIYIKLAECQLKLNNPKNACMCYVEVFEKNKTKLIFDKIVNLLFSQNCYEKVINLIEHNQNFICPLINLIVGYCHIQINNLSEAKKHLELSLNNNCVIAKKELESFINIDNDIINIDIDKMYGVLSLLSLDQSNITKKRVRFTNDNDNDNDNDNENSNKKTKK